MKKKVLLTVLSLLVVGALVFVGFKYIWNQEEELPVDAPREYLYGNEVLFKDIFSGANCSFGITYDGKVYTWGSNTTGTLGLGDRFDRSIPEPIEGMDGNEIVKVLSGYSYTMALTTSGEIWGWGIKTQTLISGAVVPQLTPAKLDIDVGEKIVDIATGHENVLVLTESGRIFTWGEANYGNMGLGITFHAVKEPTEIPKFTEGKIVQLVATNVTCAVVTDLGELFLWGQDEYNQAQCVFLKTPTLITSLVDMGIFVSQVSIGRSIAVISDEGKVYTWGWNWVGELGTGDLESRYEPQQVMALDEVVIASIDVGASHMIAIEENGGVYSWGYNNRGQTGNALTGSLSDSFIMLPTEIKALANAGVTKVYAGSEYSIALNANGEVYSWGFGSYGQLGTGNMDTIITTPIKLYMFVK
jgi:Alpha-tubulin suppressor and related RCC1 domain-containing proteins